jgi:hypothetical protein
MNWGFFRFTLLVKGQFYKIMYSECIMTTEANGATLKRNRGNWREGRGFGGDYGRGGKEGGGGKRRQFRRLSTLPPHKPSTVVFSSQK